MSKIQQDEIREARIMMEAVVDCYDEEQRAMGWYCYLEDRLKFPFKAQWVSYKKPEGIEVEVVEMCPEDDCLEEMFVEVLYREGTLKDIFSARLSDLKPVNVDSKTTEAIADWHYWVARGYDF